MIGTQNTQRCQNSRFYYQSLFFTKPVSPLFSGLASVIQSLLRGRDAVWDSSDPLPFFLLPHLQIPSQLVTSLAKGEAAQPWTIVNYCLGQLR